VLRRGPDTPTEVGHRGSEAGSHDLLLNSATAYISQERLQL